MNLKFRISNVDMDGFLGRERHPTRTDVGLLVSPVRMEADYYDDYAGGPVLENGVLTCEPASIFSGEENDDKLILRCWTCVTEDGRLLDLMDFELEVAS